MKAPNILFLITDQQRADHTGFGGNPLLKTPNLDAIAARGTVFDRATVANPICMPNRATLHTGRMPSVHGTRMNGISLDWRAQTFVRRLREHGYRTTHVGKSHLQNMGVPLQLVPGRVEQPGEGEAVDGELPHGWDELERFSRYLERGRAGFPDDFYGYENVDMTVSHGDMCSGHYRQWLLEQGLDPKQLQGAENALSSYAGWSQVYQTALPVELYPSSYVADCAVREIEAAAADERPFFLHCSWPDPHHPFTPPGDYWDRYAPSEIPLPETFGDEHRRSMPHVQAMRAKRGTPIGFVHGWAPNEQQYRHAAVAEYGMIELIDDGVGRILASLDRQGLSDHTIVVFTSDHGDMFGDHGLILKHALHYEGCRRVPLVIARPRQAAARTNALAGTIDLAQTLLELAGVPEYHGMQGRSLVPLLDDPGSSVRDSVLIEEDEPEDPIGAGRALRMRTLVSEHARITTYLGHEHGELFDLSADPDELNNLWGRPEAATLQGELTQRLLQETLAVADETPRPDFTA